ncbi:5414_t:CDS:2 [Dentiscutata erythropus]|uniref:5414_t:CDS:1 n=1 Tax=Dentiscutata erythropus TaxID=1348616 RepID=A0A9N9NBY8_9GLOM|nr:5414_t:CDS:2 [Dentiscutata erythropus]
MSEENQNKEISLNSKCSCCSYEGNIDEFYRPRGDNPQYVHSTCNKCFESCKNKRKETSVISSKRKQLESKLNLVANSSQSDHIELEQDDDFAEELALDSPHEDNIIDNQDE